MANIFKLDSNLEGTMETFDIYQDIATRTGGDIYLGVVGLSLIHI